jgi:hypothetical protein
MVDQETIINIFVHNRSIIYCDRNLLHSGSLDEVNLEGYIGCCDSVNDCFSDNFLYTYVSRRQDGEMKGGCILLLVGACFHRGRPRVQCFSSTPTKP